MIGLKEQIAEFDARHGGNAVVADGWLLFPDGARREAHFIAGGREPSQDEYKRCKDILWYWRKRLELAVEEFTVLKGNLIRFAKASMNQRDPAVPNYEALEKLKEIRQKIKSLQAKVETAENDLENSKPDAMRGREEANQDTRINWEKFASDVQNLEV